MDVEHTKALVEFGNLKRIVEDAVFEANGTLGGLTKVVDLLLQSLTAERFSRMEFGLAAVDVKKLCKVEMNWMPVRDALAKRIRKSKSTVDNIIKAAAKARDLGDARIAALVGEGVDPTEGKYDSLIDDLLETPFFGTPSEAREVVRQMLVRFRAARQRIADKSRKAKLGAEASQLSRMRRMIKDRLRHVPSGKRDEMGLTIIRELAEAFEKELPGFRLECFQGNRKVDIGPHHGRRYIEHVRSAPQDDQAEATTSATALYPVSIAI